jgi:hypothetical protein
MSFVAGQVIQPWHEDFSVGDTVHLAGLETALDQGVHRL